jgi:hypothetical protein
MFGNLQVEKIGMAALASCGPFSNGAFANSGFVADPRSPNALGGLWNPLALIVPNSGLGPDALKSFSVIFSGTISDGSGKWFFGIPICTAPPLVALISKPAAVNAGWSSAQPLPAQSAFAAYTISSQTSFALEADITVENGSLSGSWTLSLDGSQVSTGSCSNLPSDLDNPIAALAQISMPSGASISDVTLAVSVQGFSGNVQTLNL